MRDRRVQPPVPVVLRDPGTSRLQFYTSDGEPAGSWRIRGGFHTSNPMAVDSSGAVYTQVIAEPMTLDELRSVAPLRTP